MTKRPVTVIVGGGLALAGLLFWLGPTPLPPAAPPVPLGGTLPRTRPPPTPGLVPPAPHPTSVFTRLMNGEGAELRPDQVQGYLLDNHRDAASLLAAFRATHDQALLKEAEEKYPNDPQVAMEAAWRSGSPEDRRKWLDTFKRAAPDNAVPNLLSAASYFRDGQPEQAVQEVMAAARKPIQDYSRDFGQSAEEAYLAAGYSAVDAKGLATTTLLLPQMAEYKAVAVGLADMANAYRQAGDQASAQASLQWALNLGQRLDDPSSLTEIQSLVGIAVQRIALNGMDPGAAPGDGGQTVQSQLDALTQERQTFKTLNQQWDVIQPTVSDQDALNYFNRRWLFGEQAAAQWIVAKYGPQTGR